MLVLKYEKLGRSKFISHIDILRHMTKIFRRGQINVNFSLGFNPHELLYFSPPTPVGTESEAEFVAIDTDDVTDFLNRFSQNTIEGVTPLKLWHVEKNPNLAGKSFSCLYSVPFSDPLLKSLENVMAQNEFSITFPFKDEEKTVEIRQHILNVERKGDEILLNLKIGNPTLRPDRLLAFLGSSTDGIKRLKLFVSAGSEILDAETFLDREEKTCQANCL